MSKPAGKQLPPAIHIAMRQCFEKLNHTKRHATLAFATADISTKQRHELEQVHGLLQTELSLRALQSMLYNEIGNGEVGEE